MPPDPTPTTFGNMRANDLRNRHIARRLRRLREPVTRNFGVERTAAQIPGHLGAEGSTSQEGRHSGHKC